MIYHKSIWKNKFRSQKDPIKNIIITLKKEVIVFMNLAEIHTKIFKTTKGKNKSLKYF